MIKKLLKYSPAKKGFRWGAHLSLVIALAASVLANNPLEAQGIPKNTPDQIDEYLKKSPQGGGGQVRKSPLDEVREKGGVSRFSTRRLLEKRALDEQGPLSQIERSFVRRIWGAEIRAIRQFGYGNFRMAEEPDEENLFGSSKKEEEFVPLTGAISESYLLGIGDDLVVTYQGREEDTFSIRVDREGQLILPKLPPVPAAGRTFGELRADVEARVASTLVGTQVFLSLGTVRVVSVYVVGEVENPGLHRLASLSTIVDALVKAGGVLKTGSLRQIEITRGDRRFLFDTYDLLLSGGPNYDLSLMDGDRVFVPAISSVVAASGDVNRPAIYELPYGHQEISVAELLHMSGGPIIPRGNRIVLVSIDAAGRAITSEPQDLAAAIMRGGEYIQVIPAEGLEGGVVTVQGHVNNPGARSLVRAPTIGALLSGSELFQTNPYLYFATLRRTDPASLTTSLLPLNLSPILSGEVDVGLQNRDVLSVFSIDDIRFMISPDVQAVIQGRTEAKEEGEESRVECEGLDVLAAIMDGERADRYARSKYYSRRFGEIKGAVLKSEKTVDCPVLFHKNPELLAFLLEHSVVLSGEVRRPGIFPVTEGTRLSGLLSAAGGLSVEADLRQVEVSSSGHTDIESVVRRTYNLTNAESAQVTVNPGDTVRVNSTVSGQDLGPVIVEGEVRRPGIYNIRRGERLSEIIARAGGLTEQAFSKGTVFTREAARVEEQKAFGRLADQLQMSLASNLLVVGSQDGGSVGELSLAAQQLVTQLRETTAVGRVMIEADPTVLAVDSSMDTILEPDDRVFIPKRPNWISVSGAVLNPGTVQFAPGSDPRDYIEMVGGYTDAADEGRVFVVYPDGRAQPVRTAFWNFQSVQLIPGSSVVVPMDATPFRFLPIAREVTSIMSQLSIAAASLAVISRN
ncbi:MAG: SLBB domain-containing protein [Rhodospirillales bacterium]|nr:SLBB domain-containing protein [Rhodospirillales bacterium]